MSFDWLLSTEILHVLRTASLTCKVAAKNVSVEEHMGLHEEDQRCILCNGNGPCRVIQDGPGTMLSELNEKMKRLGWGCGTGPQSGMLRSRKPFLTPPCSIRAPRLMPEGPSLTNEKV